MFTGIVEEVGRVVEVVRASGRARLTVEAPKLSREVEIGDSVAVDGACLTVAERRGDLLLFDVVPETLGKTTLGGLSRGAPVNLEGALRVGDRLSGHFVMGHVDGTGEVVRREDGPGQVTVRVRVPPAVEPFLLEKGSVAVAGVSLTAFDVAGPEFSVALVPHTLRSTTLTDLGRGDPVNLEADVLARWVAKQSAPRPDGLTLAKLREEGYDSSSSPEE